MEAARHAERVICTALPKTQRVNPNKLSYAPCAATRGFTAEEPFPDLNLEKHSKKKKK